MEKYPAVNTSKKPKFKDIKIFVFFGEFLLRLARCWAICLVPGPPADFQ
jgi:hypothetical protein